MLKLATLAVTVGAATAAALQGSRRTADERQADLAWDQLLGAAAAPSERFHPSMVAGLPEPAQRFFAYAIQPGTQLSAAVEITMEGELSLGTKEDPKYQPMRARQLLVSPHGLVWRVQAGSGWLRMSGSDGMVQGRSWTRFWLFGLVPIVRAGDSPDHSRASFGRVVAEAAIWSPASVLPQANVQWRELDADTARATVTHRGMVQEVDIRVNAQGQPLWVRIPRWTDANPQKEFRVQPFGGELSDFRQVGGYRLPFRVDGGNFFGTDDYFPFYRARVRDIRVL
ncbi:DUF6544 family protein [Ramlibacter sp. AN1015]|uniref:DUF6544 family protein n=1 Tax=Ramlibacter sp. AN1015 TaxID=3133428 RepID=UPI0030BA6282